MKKLITIASMLSIGFTSVAMDGFVNLNRSNNSGSPHWMYEVSRVNDNVFYEGELTRYQFDPNWESMIFNVQSLRDSFSEAWELSHLKALIITGKIGCRRKLLEKLSSVFQRLTIP